MLWFHICVSVCLFHVTRFSHYILFTYWRIYVRIFEMSRQKQKCVSGERSTVLYFKCIWVRDGRQTSHWLQWFYWWIWDFWVDLALPSKIYSRWNDGLSTGPVQVRCFKNQAGAWWTIFDLFYSDDERLVVILCNIYNTNWSHPNHSVACALCVRDGYWMRLRTQFNKLHHIILYVYFCCNVKVTRVNVVILQSLSDPIHAPK